MPDDQNLKINSSNQKLRVSLMWHMHQPDYRDAKSGQYQQPWTYLHTIKDYVDMVMHLEAHPNARVIVNFTPILLEQIDDYAQQVRNFFEHKVEIQDPLLSTLANPNTEMGIEERKIIVNWCSRANEKHIIQRFSAYQDLIQLARDKGTKTETLEYLNNQFIVDLIVWYHLAWLAENVRRSDVRIKRLLKKKRGYDEHDRIELLTVISELLSSIIPRYRNLALSKQIELAVTPYSHPIIPLLIDLNTAKEAMPDAPLPRCEKYPGGEKRSQWHIKESIKVFEHYFGFTPDGCWPSEGALSEATCEMLDQNDFKWTASGGEIFWNSVRKINAEEQLNQDLSGYAPNQLDDQNITIFFRDDRLSDLIGFEYSSWHADDAVANFVHNLKEIYQVETNHQNQIVSIIMDGENAWEHYPNNGYYFLSALYKELSNHPDIELNTYSAFLNDHNVKRQHLNHLVAGSWVHGTMSTWIGSQDKNRGWEMLCDAKKCFDKAVESDILSTEQYEHALKQLSICEGSDWFWWFGDYNSAESVSDFEKLYRENLINLYQIIGQPIPEYLFSPFTFGQGNPEGGGSMRRSG